MMNEDYLIKLTLTLYQITDTWDGYGFLKVQLRNLSNEILVDFILVSRRETALDIQAQLIKNINTINTILLQARSNKLINREHFLMFQREYDRIKDEIQRMGLNRIVKTEETKPLKPKKEARQPKIEAHEPKTEGPIGKRQGKILKLLEKKEKTQVSGLKQIFPDVSKRTLRRDLDDLLKKGLVERKGEWNQIFYTLSRGRTG